MRSILPLITMLLFAGCGGTERKAQDLVNRLGYTLYAFQNYSSQIESLENKEIYRILVTGKEHMKYFPTDGKDGQFLDPWENPLKFFRDSEGYIIPWSAGEDGVFEPKMDGDDIVALDPLIFKSTNRSSQPE